MYSKEESSGGIKLLDAVEALASIVETPWEMESFEGRALHDGEDWKNAGWLKSGNKEEVVSQIKTIFKVILTHLKDYYQEDRNAKEFSENNEKIKSIMLIVGQAAKKIDRYTDLFHAKNMHSVTETKEYRQLQDFYKKKISKTIDEAVLGKWILALTSHAFKEQSKVIAQEKRLDAGHVFVDLDSVKNDTEYELFFIRKQDGSRFFNARLIKNITLICDFGLKIGQEADTDPLVDLSIWSDRYGQSVASRILKRAKTSINHYFPAITHHKESLICSNVHKALMALFSASNPDRLLSSGSSKGCLSYLGDFQMYLRSALETRAYQHMIAFPEQEFRPEDVAGKKVIDVLLHQIYESTGSDERLDTYVSYLVNISRENLSSEHKKGNGIWNRLARDYSALHKYLRNHPNGPLNKVLNLLEDGDYNFFDPYLQLRMPETVYELNSKGKIMHVHVLPSPTKQESIHKASVIDEWLGYLHSKADSENILLINFQDNTSWKEYARAQVLEKLQSAEDFDGFLKVVTLPKDTEFYHQEMPYEDINQLSAFKKAFSEQILGEHTGFYFPDAIKEHITAEWINGMFSVISRLFFSGKNVLSKDARLSFIEIFYAFLELKIVEILHPTDLFFTCKDGVDISPTAASEFFVMLKLLSGSEISQEDMDLITGILYKPALLSRERVLLPERAERMLGAIKVMESAANDLGDKFTSRIESELTAYFNPETLKLAING